MFCPRCKAEYREGITRCADCGVDLVEKLTPPPVEEGIDFVELLETFNVGDVAMIKSILGGADVPFYFLDENFLDVRPLVEPARLMVPREQIPYILELLKDLRLTYKGISGAGRR
jgi:hypothetical protein